MAKAGDTMTGPLVLPGAPVSSLQAANKGYVDTGFAGAVVYTSSWPARPSAPGVVLWIGPSAPPIGGSGGAGVNDVWLNNTA